MSGRGSIALVSIEPKVAKPGARIIRVMPTEKDVVHNPLLKAKALGEAVTTRNLRPSGIK